MEWIPLCPLLIYEPYFKNTLLYNSEEEMIMAISLFLSLSGLLLLLSPQGYEKTRKKRNVWNIWTLADKAGVRVFQLQEPSGAASESP